MAGSLKQTVAVSCGCIFLLSAPTLGWAVDATEPAEQPGQAVTAYPTASPIATTGIDNGATAVASELIEPSAQQPTVETDEEQVEETAATSEPTVSTPVSEPEQKVQEQPSEAPFTADTESPQPSEEPEPTEEPAPALPSDPVPTIEPQPSPTIQPAVPDSPTDLPTAQPNDPVVPQQDSGNLPPANNDVQNNTDPNLFLGNDTDQSNSLVPQQGSASAGAPSYSANTEDGSEETFGIPDTQSTPQPNKSESVLSNSTASGNTRTTGTSDWISDYLSQGSQHSAADGTSDSTGVLGADARGHSSSSSSNSNILELGKMMISGRAPLIIFTLAGAGVIFYVTRQFMRDNSSKKA